MSTIDSKREVKTTKSAKPANNNGEKNTLQTDEDIHKHDEKEEKEVGFIQTLTEAYRRGARGDPMFKAAAQLYGSAVTYGKRLRVV